MNFELFSFLLIMLSLNIREFILKFCFNVNSPSNISTKNSDSICEMLEGTELENKTIAIVRILGANLPPLHGPTQISLNLRFILEREISVQQSSNCIQRIWVIGCHYNSTEKSKLMTTLTSYSQKFYHVPSCNNNHQNNLSKLTNIFHVNIARNFGIQRALELAKKPSWILPFDGNIFLPRDAIVKILSRMIKNEEENLHVQTIPMFRLLQCQNALLGDNFKLVDEISEKSIKPIDDIAILTSILSDKQEGQLAVSSKFDRMKDLFSENLIYFKRDKVEFLQNLKYYNKNLTSCGFKTSESFFNRRVTRDQTLEQITQCGYVIRLSYWPGSDNCNYVTDWETFTWNIRQRPEVNIGSNNRLRKAGMAKLLEYFNHTKEELYKSDPILYHKHPLTLSLNIEPSQQMVIQNIKK